MELIVLETANLSKRYKKQEVLKDFSITLKAGHIYGLIGPNGAGKTTFLKILAGLTAPTSGTLRFFESDEALREQRSRMGFLVEAPFLEGNMTAYENMYLQRLIKGVTSTDRIQEVLELVGLADTGKKKAKNFSLGMRQRLGIGMALLSDPELLVLDEPVNGLDPEGIVHIRNLLLKLNHEKNMTMIISSHILSELNLLATDYIFLKKGEMLGQLSADALEQHSRSYLELHTGNAEKAAVILEKKLGLTDYQVQEDKRIHLFEGIDDPGHISQALFQEGVQVLGLNLIHANLEDYYMTLMGEQTETAKRRDD